MTLIIVISVRFGLLGFGRFPMRRRAPQHSRSRVFIKNTARVRVSIFPEKSALSIYEKDARRSCTTGRRITNTLLVLLYGFRKGHLSRTDPTLFTTVDEANYENWLLASEPLILAIWYYFPLSFLSLSLSIYLSSADECHEYKTQTNARVYSKYCWPVRWHKFQFRLIHLSLNRWKRPVYLLLYTFFFTSGFWKCNLLMCSRASKGFTLSYFWISCFTPKIKKNR